MKLLNWYFIILLLFFFFIILFFMLFKGTRILPLSDIACYGVIGTIIPTFIVQINLCYSFYNDSRLTKKPIFKKPIALFSPLIMVATLFIIVILSLHLRDEIGNSIIHESAFISLSAISMSLLNVSSFQQISKHSK